MAINILTTNLSILIVEDDKDCAQLLESVLNEKGHSVQIASCQDTAIKLFSESNFDIVMLDISLPDGLGYHLICHFQAKKATTRIIITSALSESEIRQNLKTIGCHVEGIFIKPFDIGVLLRNLIKGAEPDFSCF
ncbi:MAG: response regulator transcription factor [Candidatus Melainabacteria bacterium]